MVLFRNLMIPGILSLFVKISVLLKSSWIRSGPSYWGLVSNSLWKTTSKFQLIWTARFYLIKIWRIDSLVIFAFEVLWLHGCGMYARVASLHALKVRTADVETKSWRFCVIFLKIPIILHFLSFFLIIWLKLRAVEHRSFAWIIHNNWKMTKCFFREVNEMLRSWASLEANLNASDELVKALDTMLSDVDGRNKSPDVDELESLSLSFEDSLQRALAQIQHTSLKVFIAIYFSFNDFV